MAVALLGVPLPNLRLPPITIQTIGYQTKSREAMCRSNSGITIYCQWVSPYYNKNEKQAKPKKDQRMKQSIFDVQPLPSKNALMSSQLGSWHILEAP